MLRRPFGITLLTATLLAAGVVGITAFLVALVSWLATPGTSPLALLVALAWSCTFLATTVLTWRRSRRAPAAFLAATGLLLVLLSFIFPAGQLLVLALFVVTLFFAMLGYRYLRRACEPVA